MKMKTVFAVQCLDQQLWFWTHRRARGAIVSPASTCAVAWRSDGRSSRKQSVHAVVHSGLLEVEKSKTSNCLRVEMHSGAVLADS